MAADISVKGTGEKSTLGKTGKTTNKTKEAN